MVDCRQGRRVEGTERADSGIRVLSRRTPAQPRRNHSQDLSADRRTSRSEPYTAPRERPSTGAAPICECLADLLPRRAGALRRAGRRGRRPPPPAGRPAGRGRCCRRVCRQPGPAAGAPGRHPGHPGCSPAQRMTRSTAPPASCRWALSNGQWPCCSRSPRRLRLWAAGSRRPARSRTDWRSPSGRGCRGWCSSADRRCASTAPGHRGGPQGTG